MPLTADSIVRMNSGGFAPSVVSGPIPVALAGADVTEAGNTVIVLIYSAGAGTYAAESGWLSGTSNGLARYTRGPTQGLTSGESSWTFDFGAAGTYGRPVSWVVLEIEGVAASVDGYVDTDLTGTDTSGNTAQLLSGQTSTFDGMVVCVQAAYDSASTTPPVWSGHDGGFTEMAAHGQAGATAAVGLSVSVLPVQTLGSYGANTTVTRGGGGALDATNLAVLRTFTLNAEGARKAPNLYYIDGAEHGVVTNNTLIAGSILTSVTAGVTVDAAAARSGNFGWNLTSTAAACNYTQNRLTLAGAGTNPPMRRCFSFPSLPPDATEFWSFTTDGGVVFTFRHVSGGQIGCKIGAGSEQVSDSVIVADQWFAIDVGPDFRSTNPAGVPTARWMVDYNAELTDGDPAVVQTDVVGTGGLGGAGLSAYRVGWTAAATTTMYTDDAVVARERSHYPIGDIRVLPLKVDPAGTITISDGVTTNWGVTTNNGSSVAAWNAANALAAIDEVPPTIGGSRDGLVAVTASASAYAQIPAEPFDLAANKANVRGVQVIACVGAVSTTAATMRLTGYDGTSTYTVYNEADPNADNTNPTWIAAMYRPASGRTDWTQAGVDGLALRFGSNDATPDVWLDNVVWELAVVKAQPETLFGEAGEPVYVEAHRDPDSLALVGATVTNISGEAVELTWEVDGVPDSSGSIADGTTDLYVPISADGGIENVGTVTLKPA